MFIKVKNENGITYKDKTTICEQACASVTSRCSNTFQKVNSVSTFLRFEMILQKVKQLLV